MKTHLARTLIHEARALLQGSTPAHDAKAEQALAVLNDARAAAQARLEGMPDCQLITMADTRAARRRNWTPRGIIIAALAGWRALWHRSAATAVTAPLVAVVAIGTVALPHILQAPAPRHGPAVVRTHHPRRRAAAVTAPGRHGNRRHHGGATQGTGQPVGTVNAPPVGGQQPDPPQPPGDPVQPPPLPVPVQLPVPPVQLPPVPPLPPVDLPPVPMPLPPVELPPVPPVQLPPIHLPPVPPGQNPAQPVTGAAGGVVSGAGQAAGGLLGGT